MKISEKSIFLDKSIKTLEEIYDMLKDSPTVRIEDFKSDETALIIVDMINGFVREGALKSDRAEVIIGNIVSLSKACDDNNIAKIAFADCHTDASPEFLAYPPHCIAGTSESEVVDEIKEVGGYKLIPKNSTNSFLEKEFDEWLGENKNIKNFIVTGVCTDICVQQFSITMKTWFNTQNIKSRIIVPMDCVETYDLGVHNAELVNVMALYNMIINGVEVVKKVEA